MNVCNSAYLVSSLEKITFINLKTNIDCNKSY